MKKLSLALTALALSTALFGGVTATGAHAEESTFLRAPLALSYSSSYWWRGVELNGKDVGVVWANAGLELGGTGISLFVAAGLPEDYLLYNNSGYESYHKTQKTLSEFDYGAGYSTTIADIVNLGVSLVYIHYPFYDEADPGAIDPSFIEGSLSVGLKTVLNPTVYAYYDYYVEESAAKTPQDEDYYLKFSVSHDILSAGDFTFTAGAWVGYYNNAYLEREGWSDAGASLAIAKSVADASFRGAVYYARSLSTDFQLEDSEAGRMKNHLWAEFGMSYKI